jgi:hypothetical protein
MLELTGSSRLDGTRKRDLEALVAGIRTAVGSHADWPETARLVAAELERHLPSRPGQTTPIHDHLTWCVFAVVQGMEYEELFALDEANECLVEAGSNVNETGDVSGFAPPGDIHRVRNAGDRTAISIHVYGTDVSRVGSSVRRYYDLPVRAAAERGV